MKYIISIILAMFAATPVMAQVAIAGSQSGAQAGAGAVSAGNTVEVPVTFNSPDIPANTRADLKNVPSLGGMGGWAYAAPSGPCLGPSETKQGGAQAVWMGAGGGLQYGEGQSNLDWGCVILREMAAADSLCKAKIATACADLGKLYEMLPGISAIRAGSMPAYAKAQTVARPAPAAQPRASNAPAQTAAIQQPMNCTSDPFISKRTGSPICR